ncbi:MAG: hypothetical protein LBV51_00570 [Acholeplasmatales bacterium]|jgi:hypothetical protein|nr:hypothetical protein [Acholeplasmatales bacterium]
MNLYELYINLTKEMNDNSWQLFWNHEFPKIIKLSENIPYEYKSDFIADVQLAIIKVINKGSFLNKDVFLTKLKLQECDKETKFYINAFLENNLEHQELYRQMQINILDINTFNEEYVPFVMSMKLSNFIVRVVKTQLFLFWKKYKKQIEVLDIEDYFDTIEKQNDNEDFTYYNEKNISVEDIYKYVGNKDALFLKEIYENNLTLKELSIKLCVSHQAVSAKLKRLLDKCRRRFIP